MTTTRRRRLLLALADHALVVCVAVVFIAPLVFLVLTSLMTDRQALTSHLWPRPFRWSNFADVFRQAPLLRDAWNTTQVAVLATLGTVLSSIPAAYALSRMQWKGRDGVLLLVLATYMLPAQATIIPAYIVFAKLHWVGSFKPLIIPSFFGNAFSIFLLRQFFLTVPAELGEMARMEGASEFGVLTRVVLPLTRPAIGAVALFSFVYTWNDFFLPLLYVGENRHLWTLSLTMAEFRTAHHVEWNLTMAASVLVMLPVVVVFVLAQRVLIEGVTLTSGAPRLA